MTAFYNEHDPFAAAWLRELIKAGHIAPGVVDERSIEDVLPNELAGFTQCHFFAGIGIWSYALRQAGWPDDRPVWTGSCPCQPFSTAGQGAGFADKRHLWPAFNHLISQCRPAIVFGEQVASKDADTWIDLVHTDMEALGYAFGAIPIPSAGVGAPHIRDRLYWVADSEHDGHGGSPTGAAQQNCDRSNIWIPDRGCSVLAGQPATSSTNGFWRDADWLGCRDDKWRPVEPGTFPLADGAAARMGRLRGYGNAINAGAAKAFIESFMN